MNKFSLLTLPLFVAFALPAVAEDMPVADKDHTGFYVGGAINQVTLDISDSGESDSESATGFGAYGGYNFNEWFGLEANLFLTTGLGDSEFDVAAGALTFAPKFTLQFNETFSGYAKVGLSSMAVVVDSAFDDVTFSGVGFTYGVGLNASVSKHLNLRLSYDVTTGDLDSDDYDWIDNIDTDIKQLALGLHYQF